MRTTQALARGSHAACGRRQRTLPQQAEFAADLWQVHLGEGTDEYREPGRVLPPHLPHRQPQAAAGRAACGDSPGGAATPSCSSRPTSAAARRTRCWRLYHLFVRAPRARDLAGIDAVLAEAELGAPYAARGAGGQQDLARATRLHEARRHRSAHALGRARVAAGGKKAFARIQADDEKATSPGDVIRELFNEYGPSLVLIDEWVAYARQLHDQGDLPAGSFETQFTFAEALTELGEAGEATACW